MTLKETMAKYKADGFWEILEVSMKIYNDAMTRIWEQLHERYPLPEGYEYYFSADNKFGVMPKVREEDHD